VVATGSHVFVCLFLVFLLRGLRGLRDLLFDSVLLRSPQSVFDSFFETCGTLALVSLLLLLHSSQLAHGVPFNMFGFVHTIRTVFVIDIVVNVVLFVNGLGICGRSN
jgi:hypothetical protein